MRLFSEVGLFLLKEEKIFNMRAYIESFSISLGMSSNLLCLSEERWEQGDLSFGLPWLWGGAKLHCGEYFCTRRVSMNSS